MCNEQEFKQKIMKEFMYYVNGRYFTTLKSARNYATGDHGRDVLLTYGDYDETILSYHPMSERLERIQTVNQAKEKLLREYEKKQFIK